MPLPSEVLTKFSTVPRYNADKVLCQYSCTYPSGILSLLSTTSVTLNAFIVQGPGPCSQGYFDICIRETNLPPTSFLFVGLLNCSPE